MLSQHSQKFEVMTFMIFILPPHVIVLHHASPSSNLLPPKLIVLHHAALLSP
jgi:hypothetical protein